MSTLNVAVSPVHHTLHQKLSSRAAVLAVHGALVWFNSEKSAISSEPVKKIIL
jgi:hypothetical protein